MKKLSQKDSFFYAMRRTYQLLEKKLVDQGCIDITKLRLFKL